MTASTLSTGKLSTSTRTGAYLLSTVDRTVEEARRRVEELDRLYRRVRALDARRAGLVVMYDGSPARAVDVLHDRARTAADHADAIRDCADHVRASTTDYQLDTATLAIDEEVRYMRAVVREARRVALHARRSSGAPGKL